MGSPHYMSPEQARGMAVDHRSDLYSVGCLLYELLAGRPPFTGDSALSITYQHVTEPPAAPSTLDPRLSSGIDTLVMRALEKAPGDRYQSADQMRADLHRLRSGQQLATPATTEPPEPLESTRGPARPHDCASPDPSAGGRGSRPGGAGGHGTRRIRLSPVPQPRIRRRPRFRPSSASVRLRPRACSATPISFHASNA